MRYKRKYCRYCLWGKKGEKSKDGLRESSVVFLERRRKAFPTEPISEAKVWSVKCVWGTAHSEVPWSGLSTEWEGWWYLRCSCRGRRGQITKDWIYEAKDFRLFSVSSGEPWKALKQGGM